MTAIRTIQQAAATIAQNEGATILTAAQAAAIKMRSGQARSHSPVHTTDANLEAIMKLLEPLKAAAEVTPAVAANVGLMGILVAAGVRSTLLLLGGWDGAGEAGGKESAEEGRAGAACSSAVCLLRSFRA